MQHKAYQSKHACENFSLGSCIPCRVGRSGSWSSKGCELVFRNTTHISCQCNHLTSFAVLMDISKREVNRIFGVWSHIYTRVQSIGFSILYFLIRTLVCFFLAWGCPPSESSDLHYCLLLSGGPSHHLPTTGYSA